MALISVVVSIESLPGIPIEIKTEKPKKLSVKLFEAYKKTSDNNNNTVCCSRSECQTLNISIRFSECFFLATGTANERSTKIRAIHSTGCANSSVISLVRLVFNDKRVKKGRAYVCVCVGRTWCKYLHKIGHTFTIIRAALSAPHAAAWLKCYSDCFRSTSSHCYRSRRHRHRSTAGNLQARAIAHSIPAFVQFFFGSVPTVSNLFD